MKNKLALLAGLAWLACGTNSNASVVVTAIETGGDVVISSSGTIDLTGWAYLNSGFQTLFVQPNFAAWGVDGTLQDFYQTPLNFSGPANFGSSSFSPATAGSGDAFHFLFSGPVGPYLGVPAGYTSGDLLSSSNTFAGASFASLGITPDTYLWTWGAGGNADSLTFTVTTVPIPAAAWLFGSALLGLGGLKRKKA